MPADWFGKQGIADDEFHRVETRHGIEFDGGGLGVLGSKRTEIHDKT